MMGGMEAAHPEQDEEKAELARLEKFKGEELKAWEAVEVARLTCIVDWFEKGMGEDAKIDCAGTGRCRSGGIRKVEDGATQTRGVEEQGRD